jgi:hypothetical protein
MVAANDPDVVGQAVAAHGRAVAAAAVGGDRPPAPVDIGDRAVPKPGQVVDDLADPSASADRTTSTAPPNDPAPDHHHRQLPPKGAASRARHRAEEDQGLAPEVDQRPTARRSSRVRVTAPRTTS